MTVFQTMRRGARVAALLLGSLLSLAALAGDSIDQHLARAEAVKRSQLSAFVAELEAVEAELPLLNPRQREHLQYLRTWQEAYSGNLDAAIKGFQALIDNGSDPLLRFRSRVTMLNALTLTRRYADSYEQLNLILEQLADIEDADARTQALGATAQLLNQVGQYDESLGYSKRLLEEGTTAWARCGAAQLRYESLVKSGRMTDVDAELLRQADECADIGEHVFAGLMRTYIAELQMRNGRNGEAIAGLVRHQTAIRDTRYPYLTADVAAKLATAYLAQGNHQQAEAAAREAINSTAPGVNTEALAEAWRVIYLIADHQGDHLRALRALEQHQKADRAWLDDVGQRALAFEMARHQSRAKALQIDGLNQQNQVLQLQQQISAQSVQSARLSILLLLTVLAFALLWTLHTRRVNRHFREIAERDALTGVCSRQHFMVRAGAALEQMRRAGEPAVAVLIDLDQFKQINDRYGHAVGDDVLRRAAIACRQLLGSADLIGRLGGEEFAILLPGQSSVMAAAWAERCRATLREIRFGPESEANLLSGSFGIASTDDSGHDLGQLLADSDAAMYAAKREGRDRVVVHSAPMKTVAPASPD
jgi:diguanylate cyclase (GGDEF)-like protein